VGVSTVLTKWDVMAGLPAPAAPALRGRATRWPRQAGELCVMQGNCAGQQQLTVMSRNLRDGRRADAVMQGNCAGQQQLTVMSRNLRDGRRADASPGAENVKLRRELASCLCHGLPGELPLWLAALPRTCRILGAEPLSRSVLI